MYDSPYEQKLTYTIFVLISLIFRFNREPLKGRGRWLHNTEFFRHFCITLTNYCLMIPGPSGHAWSPLWGRGSGTPGPPASTPRTQAGPRRTSWGPPVWRWGCCCRSAGTHFPLEGERRPSDKGRIKEILHYWLIDQTAVKQKKVDLVNIFEKVNNNKKKLESFSLFCR